MPDTEKIQSSVFSFSSIINKVRVENSSIVITPPGREQIKAGEKISGVKDLEKIYLSDSNKKSVIINSAVLRKKIPDSEGRN